MVLQEWVPAIAGGLSGACQVCAEQPFDTIKTRLQSHTRGFDRFVAPSQLVFHTFRNEGFSAFFLGITPRLATYSAVKFSLFSLYERFLVMSGGSTFIAGACAGAVNSLVSCPQDVLKVLFNLSPPDLTLT